MKKQSELSTGTETPQFTIESATKIRNGYPPDHGQVEKINIQIEAERGKS